MLTNIMAGGFSSSKHCDPFALDRSQLLTGEESLEIHTLTFIPSLCGEGILADLIGIRIVKHASRL